MTVFRDRLFKGIIKLKWGLYSEPQLNITDILIRRVIRTQIHKEDQVNTLREDSHRSQEREASEETSSSDTFRSLASRMARKQTSIVSFVCGTLLYATQNIPWIRTYSMMISKTCG